MRVEAQRDSQAMHWSGWDLSGIVIAFLIADCGATLLGIAPLRKAMLEIGYPLGLMWLVGALEFVCVVLMRSRPPPCSAQSSSPDFWEGRSQATFDWRRR